MNCHLRTLSSLAFVLALSLYASVATSAQTIASSAQSSAVPGVVANVTSGPRIWLQANQPLPVQHVAASVGNGQATSSAGLVAGLGQAQPVSLTSGDLDADGFEDLVVGYSSGGGGYISVQRGNIDAFAPQSDASFQAIGRGEFPSPFHLQAQTFSVPVRPDFVVLGNFTGQGNKDLVIGARGGNTVYVLPNDGKGNFGAPQAVNVGIGITALAAGEMGKSHTGVLVVGGGRSLSVYVPTQQGLAALASYGVGGPVSNIVFGDFGDPGPNVAFLSGGKVRVLRSSTMQVTTVSLPVTVSAFALGSFLPDRNPGPQLAVVGVDGSIQIAVHNEFDPRLYSSDEVNVIRNAAPRGRPNPLIPGKTFPVNGWKIAESFPGVGAMGAGQTPVFFSTRVSSHGADDVMLLNAFSGQLVVISHEDPQPGATTYIAGQVSLRPYTGTAIAAVPMRINVDGRPGVMAIHQGELAPSMLMPIPDPTFFVNRFDDPVPGAVASTCNNVSNADTSTSCSLREAVRKANATAGTDTIQLVSGTYTLTQARVSGDFTAAHGTLDITDSVNIVGAVDGSGNPASIIQACDPTPNPTCNTGVDKVFSFNQDISAFTNATVSISNLVIRFGHNRGAFGGLQDGFGGAFDYDTGGTTAGTGNANLTVTNCLITNNATTDGDGGGVAVFNTNSGTGFAHFVSSTIQNNSPVRSTSGAAGGGIFVGSPARIVLDSTKILNNTATQTSPATGNGGGIFTFGQPDPSVASGIHASTISGNQAAGDGGGLNLDATITIDTGTVITSNQAGTAGGGATNGGNAGGILFSAQTGDSLTLSKVTIAGNSAAGGAGATPGGGGIWLGANQQTFTMNFSRLAGNSAPNGSNLDIPVVGGGSTLSATNNWWGTNAPATTIKQGTANAVTFDPFIVLTHTGSPDKIRINQSSTLTGDMSNDNHGNAVGLANLTEIIGLPITFDSAVLGTIPQAQPETLSASAQATATFNAGGTSGFGTANATVDQAVVPVNSNLIAAATESGTTATITTVGAIGFATGDFVRISGVGVAGYNSSPATQVFEVLSTPTATSFTYTANTSGLGPSSGGTANASIVILQPPSIAKSFNPTTVAINTPSTITFSVTNGNVVPINASFTDTLPANLVVATTPAVVNSCGGTVTATAASGTISFSNNLLPIGTCTIQVNVQSAIDNTYTNSVTIDSTDAGNGNTSSADLTVINPPSIAKAFGAATIPLNGTTSLTFTLTSSNQNLTLNGVAFTDSLPAGLVAATPANLNNTCGGTATATDGSSSVSLSSASLAPGASCSVSVNVTGTTAGIKNNSVQVSSTNGGTGNTSNASVTVVGPPGISKAFGAASIPLNGSTSLSFTINNPNGVTLTGVGFTDTLPAGLIISTPNGLTGSCGGGTITATQNTNAISLSGASLAASASCTFSVNVTGTAAGVQNNTTSAVTSNEGGTGNTASATVHVEAPPSIAKVFNPSSIALNATTSLTFTITNPAANPDALTGVAFTDALPTGLTVASSTATVCGGTLTTTAPTGIALSGATISTNSNCQFSVTVTGAASGQYTNTSGNVTSTNGGTGNTASANLSVATPVSISKAFGAASIPVNGVTSLTFSISNPNSSSASGIAFTDTLPAGLIVATPSNLSNTCGGTATATAGSGSVSLSGGTLGSTGSCTVSVNIQGTTAGVKNNSVTVSSTEGGTGNTSNASITVVSPPGISKGFGAASIPLSGSTSLSFAVSNSNGTTLTGVGFTDTLPAGLVISTPNGLTGSCGGGTITATQNTSVISLSGASLAASASCTFSVNVTGTSAGAKNNTTSPVTSNEGGTGGAASASLIVVAPPSIAKAFNPNSIAVNATTSLGFTITNPAVNSVALSGVSFTDVLPAGLTVANGTSTVCGGTLSTSGGNTIALSGATIAAGGNCVFSVTVTATQPGSFTNTTGNVTSTNGGTGNTASANLTVNGVTVNPTSINFGDVDALHFANGKVTVTNGGNTPAPLSISITPGTGGNADNFFFVSHCPQTLAAHTSCTIDIVFFAEQPQNSSEVGTSTATLNVTSGSTTQNVALQANVIDPEPHFNPDPLSFGSHTVGVTTTKTIVVTNVGLTALVINTVSVSGTNPADFQAVNHCTSPVAPGGSCQIAVSFTPKAKGSRTATLNVHSNDGIDQIPLSGVGK